MSSSTAIPADSAPTPVLDVAAVVWCLVEATADGTAEAGTWLCVHDCLGVAAVEAAAEASTDLHGAGRTAQPYIAGRVRAARTDDGAGLGDALASLTSLVVFVFLPAQRQRQRQRQRVDNVAENGLLTCTTTTTTTTTTVDNVAENGLLTCTTTTTTTTTTG